MSNDERREVRARIRQYEKDGEQKWFYQTVGTAWVSEHGSKISLQLDTVPVSPEWDGKFYINKPYEKKTEDDKPMPQSKVLEHDNLPNDEDLDKPFDASQIPF